MLGDEDNTEGAGELDINNLDTGKLDDDGDGDAADKLPEFEPDEENQENDSGKESEEEADDEPEEKDDAKARSKGKRDDNGAKGKSEGSEETEEETEEDEAGKGKIPYQRFKRVVDARKAAENQAAALRAQLAELRGPSKSESPVAKLQAQLDPLYEQVEDARGQGKTKEAAKLQRQIDEISGQIRDIRTEEVSTRKALEVAVNTEYATYVTEVETRFPKLNPDDDVEFDEDLAEEIREVTEGLMAKGRTPKAALEKAVALFQHKLEPMTMKGKGEAKGDKKDEPAPKSKKEEVVKARNNVDKKIEAAKRLAPDLDSAGRDHKGGKINPMALSDKQWDDLPEETKARMRGDYLK